MDALAGAVWNLVRTDAGTVADPSGLHAVPLDPIPASVPGTAGEAIRTARGRDAALATDIDGADWWWRTTVDARGDHVLLADGLATVADVWIGGRHVLHGAGMFRAHAVQVPALDGPTEVVLRCAAPLAALGRRPRPRWKTALVTDQRWRWLRTAVLGRIPTWHGATPTAGPWRPLRLQSLDTPVVAARRFAARLDGADGVVDVRLDVRGAVAAASVRIGDADGTGGPEVTRVALEPGPDGLLRATLRVPDAQLWWPHGHGPQPRYPIEVIADGTHLPLGHVAFRTVTADRSGGGFTLSVNGVDVFVRGACWTPIDPIAMRATADELRAEVARARDGGHNIIRVPGISGYEQDEFYDVCDELGMLVWQDCALVTLDVPDTAEVVDELRVEIGQLADRLAGHACVVTVCGGAESEQQPAMRGLPEQGLPALTGTIPALLAEHLPDVPYVSSSPSGGALPFHVGTGIAQYFGVGAYLRPLADVRAARVAFAAEALAFSTPPEVHAVLGAFGSAAVAGHDPRWKAGVPRDVGTSWDFEDVRDHYVRELFAVEPMLVRYADPERYLDLGRAAVCTAMTEVVSWWRRPVSECAGAIVLSARDLTPGAGWGLLDWMGRPKAPWFALRPILQPLALLVTDDGADGLTLTVANDGPSPIDGTLEVRTWSLHGAALDLGDVPVHVGAHAAVDVGVDAVLGRFTDAGHYYRFGPRTRDLLRVRLLDARGEEMASHTAQLGHHLREVARGGVDASVRVDHGGWALELLARRPVHWLAVDSPTHEPADSWFHLSPGERRRVGLAPVAGRAADEPRVTVRAMNLEEFAVPVLRESSVPDRTRA